MGGGAPKNTSTTQKVEPWDAAKPYYESLYGAAQQAFQNTNRAPYTGQLYAGPTSDQQQALQMFRDTAGSGQYQRAGDVAAGLGQQAASGALLNNQQLFNALPQSFMQQIQAPGAVQQVQPITNPNASRLENDILGGQFLSHETNPYLEGAVQAATRGQQNNLMRNILPQLQDQSILQGAYGGAGNGTMNALAIGDFSRYALDAANSVYNNNYMNERQLMQQAMGSSLDRSQQAALQAQGLTSQQDMQARALEAARNSQMAGLAGQNYMTERQNQLDAPMMMAQAADLNLLPAQLLDRAGQQQQSWNQAALDADLQRYNINQSAPWAGLGEWAQILNGGGFQSAGQTGSTRMGSSPASFLQGAAGAAGLANSLGGGNWLSQLFGGGGGGGGIAPAASFDPAQFAAWLGTNW